MAPEQDITNTRVFRVEVPKPLEGTFQIANLFAQGNFYLVGSSVRSCILRDSELPNDVDFLGVFDLEKIDVHFGNRVLGRSNPPGIMKVEEGDKEIDFMSFPNIREKLETMDITVTLLCMDKDGIIYDPLNCIEDLRNKRVRIENADQKIRIEPWRIIRVLRFAATWGYEVEDLTREACIKNVSLIDPKNENTVYTLKRLQEVDGGITERVLEIAKEYGISDFISKVITSPTYD